MAVNFSVFKKNHKKTHFVQIEFFRENQNIFGDDGGSRWNEVHEETELDLLHCLYYFSIYMLESKLFSGK